MVRWHFNNNNGDAYKCNNNNNNAHIYIYVHKKKQIQKRRKETGNLTIEEDMENTLVTELNKVDETLPTIEQVQPKPV